MKRREGTRSRRAKNTSTTKGRKKEDRPAAEEVDSNRDLVQLGDQDVDPDDVEFLDDDLLVVENTGEVRIGEIGGDSDDDDQGDDGERTAVAFRADVMDSGRVQRADLEDLEDLGENEAFVDRPTAELNLSSDHDDIAPGRRALDAASGFGDIEPTLAPEPSGDFSEAQSVAFQDEQETEAIDVQTPQTTAEEAEEIEVSDAEVVAEVLTGEAGVTSELSEGSVEASAVEPTEQRYVSQGHSGSDQKAGSAELAGRESHAEVPDSSDDGEIETVQGKDAGQQSTFDMDREAYQEQAHRLATNSTFEKSAG